MHKTAEIIKPAQRLMLGVYNSKLSLNTFYGPAFEQALSFTCVTHLYVL